MSITRTSHEKGSLVSAEVPTDWEGLPGDGELSERSLELRAEESLAESQLSPLHSAWWPQPQLQHLPVTTAGPSELWPRHWTALSPPGGQVDVLKLTWGPHVPCPGCPQLSVPWTDRLELAAGQGVTLLP